MRDDGRNAKPRLTCTVQSNFALERGAFDPLAWWQGHNSTYPELSQVARLYLVISATLAVSERAFSATSMFIILEGNRLGPQAVEHLQMIRDNWVGVQELFDEQVTPTSTK